MFVGILEIELLLRGNTSRKGKRQVLNSIKDRTRRKFNVAIAEVDHNDLLQRAKVGICCVSNDSNHARQMLDEILRFVEGNFQVELLDHCIEII